MKTHQSKPGCPTRLVPRTQPCDVFEKRSHAYNLRKTLDLIRAMWDMNAYHVHVETFQGRSELVWGESLIFRQLEVQQTWYIIYYSNIEDLLQGQASAW